MKTYSILIFIFIISCCIVSCKKTPNTQVPKPTDSTNKTPTTSDSLKKMNGKRLYDGKIASFVGGIVDTSSRRYDVEFKIDVLNDSMIFVDGQYFKATLTKMRSEKGVFYFYTPTDKYGGYGANYHYNQDSIILSTTNGGYSGSQINWTYRSKR